MALTDIVFKSNTCLASLRNSTGDGSRVKVDEVLRDSSLIEPEIVQVHLSAEEFGIVCLPLVQVQADQSHLLRIC